MKTTRFIPACLVLAVTFGSLFAAPLANAVTDHVVVSGLERPWAVVKSPDGNIWVTEKSGQIKIFGSAFKLLSTLSGFPDFMAFGEGGVLDLVFHPQFSRNGWVYVAYSVSENGLFRTRVNRFTYRGGRLQEHKVIFNGPLGASGVTSHFGCRLVFDDGGFLYASFGERRDMEKAQDMKLAHGKIVRLKDDGSIPGDNPFGAANPIYSLGHRNPQGLAIHPVSRKMYDSEHGPTGYDVAEGEPDRWGGDEINEITAGGNYGWPQYHHARTGPGVLPPLAVYTPAVAPSGIAFYAGTKIAAWTNDLFVATLRGQHLLRVRINASGRVIEQQKLLENKYGRLRDVETSPTGTLLVISEQGKLIELK